MEIVHLILGKANPDRLNGVNKVVYQLATEQAASGRNVEVWGITADVAHNYPDRNFTTRLFSKKRNPFGIDAALKTAILQKSGAVFHLHGGWIPVYGTLGKFFAKHRIKYVLTPHGAYNVIAMERGQLRKKLYAQLFEKALLKNAHRIHCIGASEIIGLQMLKVEKDLILLPYGFTPTTQNEIDVVKNEAFTIGFVGRLDIHTKGLDMLLHAFNIFCKTRENTELWIIGDGDGRKFIEKFIAEKKLENVILFGKKFGEDKDALIAQMHVFAHPSRNEGLPSAVLEAAALGVPSLVTEATNVGTYITDYNAGISVPNSRVPDLVLGLEQMAQMYEDGQGDDLREQSKKMIAKAFSWPIIVEQMDKLYR
ncbi:MAG: glycosyltransferase family 4 protein [Cryomorphaceae bacterium]|nr:glycosyltransferase family 4 protein [Cryomorphaceae bacterium]